MIDDRPTCWMCAEGAMKDADEIELLRVQVARLRESLIIIAGIGEGSTTENSLPHIGRLARVALKTTDPLKEPVT